MSLPLSAQQNSPLRDAIGEVEAEGSELNCNKDHTGLKGAELENRYLSRNNLTETMGGSKSSLRKILPTRHGVGCQPKRLAHYDLERAMGFCPEEDLYPKWRIDPLIKVINGRWKLGRMLGKGGYGSVYEAEDFATGVNVAVKLELSAERKSLENENAVYDCLSNTSRAYVGFPKRLYYARTSNLKRVLVLEKLGLSLSCLLQSAVKRRLFPITVLALGIQALRRLEDLHGIGFIHGDVKPANLVMGSENPMRLYLVDFGASRRYLDDDGNHVPRKVRKKRSGTVNYCSIDVHLGVHETRRNDLESLGYCILELCTGSLPWINLREEKHRPEVRKAKAELNINTIPRMELKRELSAYFKFVRALKFDEEPNYSYLRGIFREGLARI